MTATNFNHLRRAAERQAEGYKRMVEIGYGIGGLCEAHPDLGEAMEAWDWLTENKHADTVLALLDEVDRLRKVEAAAQKVTIGGSSVGETSLYYEVYADDMAALNRALTEAQFSASDPDDD